MKTRLCLLQKRVGFTTVEVTYKDLRTTWTQRLGWKATVPFIELLTDGDSEIIQGVWPIALWLEKTYPDAPSLFLPAAQSVSFDSPEYRLAINYARLMHHGLGDSDPGWTTWWEIAAPGLLTLFPDDEEDSDYRYFQSDAKQGAPNEWARLCSLDRENLKMRAKASLLPLAAVLGSSTFLAGEAPGLVDYVVYGRYIMMISADFETSEEVWRPLATWRENLEKRYENGLQAVLSRIPSRHSE